MLKIRIAVFNILICLQLAGCPDEGPAQLAGSMAAGAFAVPLYYNDVEK